VMSEQTNTKKSFHDKWSKNADCAFEQTITEGTDIFNWILTRNGFLSTEQLKDYLEKKKRILDAGCGNGRVTALLRKYSNELTTEVVGIDLVAADIAKQNLRDSKNVNFAAKDLLGNLSDLGKFDFIYCQEVLHHTSDPERAFSNLVSLLGENGEIAIYVYKKKAPVREFVDDYVRDRIGELSYEDAYKACEQITALGKMLADQKVKIKVPDVDLLEIKGGEYDMQRFVYHFFMKCFWSDELSWNENVVVNYDWYHPQLCSRHTIEEVREWFEKSGLKIVQECVDFYGITVRGRISAQ
jgi:SAM-dependent methyltransferase